MTARPVTRGVLGGVFYIVLFTFLAVLLVVAGMTVHARTRRR